MSNAKPDSINVLAGSSKSSNSTDVITLIVDSCNRHLTTTLDMSVVKIVNVAGVSTAYFS